MLNVLLVLVSLSTVEAEVSWACGQFEDNRVLATVGSPSKVRYAVNIGGGAFTTANGYTFQAWNNNTNTNVSFVATADGGYLDGGGTTGDANFDQILSSGATATSANTTGLITIKNLTAGKYYRIMLLFADTRATSAGGTVSVSAGGSSDSVTHVFAYNGGTQAMGAYASLDFPANATTESVFIGATSTRLQINAVIVSEVKTTDLTPQAVTPTLNANERVVFMATPEMFGALGDGIHNDAPAFNAAIQSIAMMGRRSSGVLWVQNKKYVLNDTVNILPGVTMHGDWKDWTTGTSGCQGATFVVEVASDGVTPALNLLNSDAVIGVNFWYPNQSAGNILAYGPSLFLDHNCLLRNIVLINSYDGIFINNGHHTLENILGTPLHTGLRVEFSAQQSYVSELHFSPGIWPKSLLAGAPAVGGAHESWMYNNGTGFMLGRDDGDSFISCSLEGYKTGAQFFKHNDSNTALVGATGATFIDCTILNTQTALMADDMNSIGLHFARCTLSGRKVLDRTSGSPGSLRMLFHTCTLSSELGNGSVAISSPALASGDVLVMTNCTINGQIVQSAGCVDLVNCTLNTTGGVPQINMMTGTTATSVTGCTFNPGKSITKAAGRLIESPLVATTSEPPPTFHWSTLEARRQAAKPAKGTLYVATASPYSAVGDGSHDDTANIQSALNAAGAAGGGIVYLPAGRYLTSGPLTVPSGVELRGVWETSHPMGTFRFGTVVNATSRNSVIWVTGGAGSSTGPSAVNLSANSGIVGVDFDYINQTSTPTAYPAVISGQGANVYIIGVTCPNAFNYVDLDSAACTNHFVYQLQGFAFEKTLKVGNGATGILADCDNFALYWTTLIDSPSKSAYDASIVRPYQDEHNVEVWLGNCPAEELVNVNTLGAQYYVFATNESGLGPVAECYGALSDNSTVSFHFEGAATNTSFYAVNSYWMLANPTSPVSQPITSIETMADFGGKARFYNFGARQNANAYDFMIQAGTIGVEGYYSVVGGTPGSVITGGCAQLINICVGGTTGNYPLQFSGRGPGGKASELINWRHANGFTYTNTDPANQRVYAANAYSLANSTVLSDAPLAVNAAYKLTNVANSLLLDSLGATAAGANVGQKTVSGTSAQQWTLSCDSSTTPATFKLQSTQNGLYLDSLGRTAVGDTVGQNTAGTSDNPKWSLTSYGGRKYRLVNVANGLALGNGSSSTSGSVVKFATAGNSSATAQVWNMTSPPLVTTPGNIVVSATSSTGATVTYPTAATDAGGAAIPVTTSPASGSAFPFGTTTVTATATDFAGNTAAKTFTVTVQVPPPASLASTVLSETQIRLSWTPVTSYSTAYSVDRSVHSANSWTSLTATLPVGSSVYTDNVLSPSTSYDYRVRTLAGTHSSTYATLTETTPVGIGDGIPGAWRYQYFGNGLTVTTASARDANPDGDDLTNFQEYLAETNPNDPTSSLSATVTPSGSDLVVSFPAVSGKSYLVEKAADLTATPAWTTLRDNLAGAGGTLSITDVGALDQGSRAFYRVRLK